MKLAYIVLAHKNPAQVARLIQSLDNNYATIFLHIDQNADASEFKTICARRDNIVAVKSVKTPRGGFGLVEATINGIKAVMDDKRTFDFVSLISGQHYPIKSNEQIRDYLNSTTRSAFIEYTSLPDYDRWEPRGGLYRIDRYFLGLETHQRFMAKTLNFLLQKANIFKRIFPENLKPFGGSQWWTLNNDSLQYIMRFIKNNEEFITFHKYSFAPDELFFHNILLNATDDKIKSGITNNNLLYMNWPDTGKGHPEILRSSDFANILTSDLLFARKFDTEQDAAILDLIDDNVRFERATKQGAF